MHQHRHLQLHQLHRRQPGDDSDQLVHITKLVSVIRRRQDKDKDKDKSGWDKFTDAIGEAWKEITGQKTTDPPNPAAPTPTMKTSMVAPPELIRETTASPVKTPTPVATTETPTRSTSPPAQKSETSAVGIPAAVVPSTVPTSSVSESELAVDTDSPTPVVGQTSNTGRASIETATASAQTSNGSGGDNAATKAGIAFGVIGGVLLVFIIAWFIVKKRREQMEQQRLYDDEKINGPFGFGERPSGAAAAAVAIPKRTRMSWESTASRRAPNADVPPPTYPKNTVSAWERPITANSNAAHPANPFGNHAEMLDTPQPQPDDPRPVSPMSPIGNAVPPPIADPALATPISPIGETTSSSLSGAPTGSAVTAPVDAAAVGVAVGGGALAVGAGILTRKTSIRKDGAPKPLDLTIPPPGIPNTPASPAGTEFSVNSVSTGHSANPSRSAAAIAAAGGPATSAVHRVQLDFKPTMDDELELKAGNLVRLLFEYDDGWALCIRLDRSEQGVVPRTCLSTRPVKPRSGTAPRPGPPVNTNMGPGAQPPAPGRSSGSIGRKPVPGQAY